ncbi:MAG TPA: hypothetical protein DIC56_17915 [Rhizobium sp.]|jgi:hypothetical protein|uniref:DUF1419 domain-containing protein n=2 Tax=Alphaproteobacteria TaxID=28211 RepID=A0A512HKK1_9HYPH|nr:MULTISPECIES: DUF1419 domain-containing protein [Alphaproteobacteria]GEO85961.1 hypothetical protein RNA01_28930 [Ciceribacter naphthalenivorans]GLR23468.1 hypothetical protein GCM10007920_32590 [Ciceribacter naphthalenivorans]GLT06324.1 hypothetical protein GCM10007926_32590 [Sphingomonas psychrolutea]HCL66673.1 hypothetical protein [Rhizobium sp.]
MTLLSIRKVYQGIADRRQMFRMFDRHAKRPSRFQDDATALYRGEWFEINQAGHDYMFEVLPPLWMPGDMFALREFLTGNVTSVFFSLKIDGQFRYFHGYCDLSDRGSPAQMRDTIVERESRPVRAMTREERLEHIWSATHDQYRAYADWRYPGPQRGKRLVMNFAAGGHRDFDLLDQLTDAQIAGKLPVHLRYLPDAIAA